MMKYIFAGLAVVIILLALTAWLTLRHGAKPVAAPVSRKTYIALGDSVAAGAGLETPSDSSACDRNDQAYPNVLAGNLKYSLTSIACSGATLENGILWKQEVNQLWIAAQQNQLFAKSTPDLITITVGANDIGWTDTLARCEMAECGTAADTSQTSNRLVEVTRNLRSLMTNIGKHYGSAAPPVLVTGYYQLFPVSGTACPDIANISAAERLWWNQQQITMDTALKTASAGFGFAHFVPVSFSGHGLCTPDPWIQGLADGAPFHPNDEGQAAIANQLAAYIRNNHLKGVTQ